MTRRRAAVLRGVLSLVLALALWTFVSFTQDPTETRRVDVPVATNGPPAPGLVVVDPQTGLPRAFNQSINVLVAGPRATLNKLQGGVATASIDLSDLNAGTHAVPVNVRAERGVRVREYAPPTLTLRLEQAATKTFPVTRRVLNEPPFVQLENTAIDVAADQAIVNGPQNAVGRVVGVRSTIDLQGRLQSYTQTLPLEAVDTNGDVVPGVMVSPNQTEVNVRIAPRVEPQQVSIVPQFVGQPPDPYVVESFDWTPRSVEVIAPTVISATLQTEPIALNQRTESFTQTVRLVNVDGLLTRLPNNTVTVEVNISQIRVTSTTPLFIATVDVLNKNPALRVSPTPPGLRVTVSGTYRQLSQLAGAKIEASVDVQGLGAGTYTLPVTIALPDGVQIVGSAPTATITLVADMPTPTPAPPAPAAKGG